MELRNHFEGFCLTQPYSVLHHLAKRCAGVEVVFKCLLFKFRNIRSGCTSNSHFKYCALMQFWLQCIEEKHSRPNRGEKFPLVVPVLFLSEI